MKKSGMGSHEQTIGINQEWLSPPAIVRSLGEFDLDPCAPVVRPWDTAKKHFTIEDDGLSKDWGHARIWMNPPYDRRVIDKWLGRMALHNNGISLIFARTETKTFQKWVFGYASSILFMEGRITFFDVNGNPGHFNAGAPSVLISYGEKNMEALGDSGIKGKHILVNYTPVIVVGISPTWRSVVTIAVSRAGGVVNLEEVYNLVEQIAPDKTERNIHYKAKVRQTLQYHFTRISEGRYTNSKTK